MTHFTNQRIDIFNEEVGGDVVKQMYQWMDKVFEHQPTVVTLSYGMNVRLYRTIRYQRIIALHVRMLRPPAMIIYKRNKY
ncbi:MAG: hypothetical protein ACOH2V_10200 [Candidatus Saccharimonadaceae bacterium]